MVAEGLPALGIVAAVLGVVKAMGALDQSPELLGGFIGAALVGTFAGIFLSYAWWRRSRSKVKVVREQQCRLYVIVKQTLLAFMNGAMPQIAIEHGRKTISVASERPSIDVVEKRDDFRRPGRRPPRRRHRPREQEPSRGSQVETNRSGRRPAARRRRNFRRTHADAACDLRPDGRAVL